MSEIPERIVLDEHGAPTLECIDERSETYIPMYRRIMTAEEVLERDQLNRDNTAEYMYKRIQVLRSEDNGHQFRFHYKGELKDYFQK